jgi:hypothetical protein
MNSGIATFCGLLSIGLGALQPPQPRIGVRGPSETVAFQSADLLTLNPAGSPVSLQSAQIVKPMPGNPAEVPSRGPITRTFRWARSE